MEQNPFPELKIDSSQFLDNLEGRSICPKCQRSRKYYCYTCYVPVEGVGDRIPKVKLPLKVDIIKHPSECDGKSTAAHAGVLAPDDVIIYTYPCIPDFENKSKVALVFPSDSSKTLDEIAEEMSTGPSHFEIGTKKVSVSCALGSSSVTADRTQKDVESVGVQSITGEDGSINSQDQAENILKLRTSNGETEFTDKQTEANHISDGKGAKRPSQIFETGCDMPPKKIRSGDDSAVRDCSSASVTGSATFGNLRGPFDKVVFIDSTWNQTKTILGDERLKGLQCIELKTRTTKFWRHQRDNPETYLSTIEAIYYFMCDYHDHFISSQYNGEYDNLLFFFKFMYDKISSLYQGGKNLKAYKKKKNS